MSFSKDLEAWNKKLWYAFFRMLFRQRPVSAPLAPATRRKILVLRYDRLGDMVVSMPALKLLHDIKGNEVHVLCSDRNTALLDDCPWVTKRILYRPGLSGFLRVIREARRENYDCLITFVYHQTTFAGILANAISNRAVKVTRSFPERDAMYSTLFTTLVAVEAERRPMMEVIAAVCIKLFGLQASVETIDYEIPVLDQRRDAVIVRIKEQLGERYIVLNISAGSAERRISDECLDGIVQFVVRQYPQLNICINATPEDKTRADELIGKYPNRVFTAPSISHILDLVVLIQSAKALISPDTSVVHMADAARVPIVGLYTKDNPYWYPARSVSRCVISRGSEDLRGLNIGEVCDAIKDILG